MSNVQHPKHYNRHPSGLECIDVVERLPFNLGNAVKYLWRADLKGKRNEDVEKAVFYINRVLADPMQHPRGAKDPELDRQLQKLKAHTAHGFTPIIVLLVLGYLAGDVRHIVGASYQLDYIRNHPGNADNPTTRLPS